MKQSTTNREELLFCVLCHRASARVSCTRCRCVRQTERRVTIQQHLHAPEKKTCNCGRRVDRKIEFLPPIYQDLVGLRGDKRYHCCLHAQKTNHTQQAAVVSVAKEAKLVRAHIGCALLILSVRGQTEALGEACRYGCKRQARADHTGKSENFPDAALLLQLAVVLHTKKVYWWLVLYQSHPGPTRSFLKFRL